MKSPRNMTLALGMSLLPLAAGCGAAPSAEPSPDVASASQALTTFDWGSDCSAGDGAFSDAIEHQQLTTIGEIPSDKRNVAIQLSSPSDVDVQLIEKSTGHQIIAWPNGMLNGPTRDCTTYKQVQYCYSGYNGVDGEKGHETIEINGDTNSDLIMRAFGYQAGQAEVEYSWQAVPTCDEKGDGTFSSFLALNSVKTIGEIPVGKVNVDIQLTAAEDLDVQLFDGDEALIKWPDGKLNGPSVQTLDHKGMSITWSGYNGTGGQLGNEYIRIEGEVSSTLEMRAFAYAAGTAQVDYEWGKGAGDTCGGIAALTCDPGLSCKGVQTGVADAAGTCHTQGWCESDATAAADCGSLPLPPLGEWTCEEFSCVVETNTDSCPSAGSFCTAICDGDVPPEFPPGCPQPMCACQPECPDVSNYCDLACDGQPLPEIPQGCAAPMCMCQPECPDISNYCDLACDNQPLPEIPQGCASPMCVCEPECPDVSNYCDLACDGQPLPEIPQGCAAPMCMCEPECPSPTLFCEQVCAGEPTVEFPDGCPQPGCAC